MFKAVYGEKTQVYKFQVNFKILKVIKNTQANLLKTLKANDSVNWCLVRKFVKI